MDDFVDALNNSRRLLNGARLSESIICLEGLLRRRDVTSEWRDEVLVELIRANINRGDLTRAFELHDLMARPHMIAMEALTIARLEFEGKFSRAGRLTRDRPNVGWQGFGRLCFSDYANEKVPEVVSKPFGSSDKRFASLRRRFWPSHDGAVLDHARVVGSDWAVYAAEAGAFLFSTYHHHLRVPAGGHPEGVLNVNISRPSRRIRGTAFMLGGYHNYYHHLIDYAMNYFYIKKVSFEKKSGDSDVILDVSTTPILCCELTREFQLDVFDLLGVPRDRLIPLGYGETVLVDHLVLLPQMTLGYGWVRDTAPRRWLRDILRTYPRSGSAVQAIYISRRSASSRRILNEDELEEILGALGIVSFVLEEMPVMDQMALFMSSKLIIAPHGAGLSNMIVAPDDTTVVELMPADGHQPDYFSNLAKSLGYSFFRFPISGKYEAMRDSTLDVSEFIHFLKENVDLGMLK